MTATELLGEAEARGARFVVTHGRIRCTHPAGADVADLIRAIGERRASVRCILDWRSGLGAGRSVGRSMAISRGYHAALLRRAGEQRRRVRECARGPARGMRIEAARNEIVAAINVRHARARMVACASAERAAPAGEAA